MDPLNRGAGRTPADIGAGAPAVPFEAMLAQTRQAFDSVAETYDGPRGNNALIQRMRERSWRAIERYAPVSSRLLDIGCGTGIDAMHFAALGHSVCATDASGGMISRATARAAATSMKDRIDWRQLGAQELNRLDGRFHTAYSNFGALNCVPDLRLVARECARLLTDRGHLVFTVIGRLCPWELGYYLLQGRPRRACVRFARDMVAVQLNQLRVWARYYTPRQFYRCFDRQFELVHTQALSLWGPPPYLVSWHERHAHLGRMLGWLDDHTGSLPLLRSAGDHFLMVLRKRH